MTVNHLKRIAQFLADYSARLIGSGVHTSRTVRNTKRIGTALGCETHLNLSMKTMTRTRRRNRGYYHRSYRYTYTPNKVCTQLRSKCPQLGNPRS